MYLNKQKELNQNNHEIEIDLPSQDANHQLDSKGKELKRITWKVDIRMIPFLTIIYLCCYLDRVNIGAARLYHLERDLNLSQTEFSWSLSIFFIGYILFEIPSNLLLKKFSPTVWIARIMITWGIVSMSLAAVVNFGGLMAARFFLGVAEAGLGPGLVYIISFWYCRNQQCVRIGIFYSASAVAGAFSGLLAYAISHIDGVWGLSAWRWIFLIEGLPSVVLGIITWFLLPSIPDEANFLTIEEKTIIKERLLEDYINSSTKKFSLKGLKEAMKDYKVWMGMLMYFGFHVPLSAIAQLLPTIIKGMGYSTVTTMLLTAPPFALAAATTIFFTWHSDKQHERCFHFISPLVFACLGFLLMILLKNQIALYCSAFLIVIGTSTALPVCLAWVSNNMVGSTKSGVAVAMVVSFGNLGGAISGQLYRSYEAPAYIPSHMTCIALILLSIVTAIINRELLRKENEKLKELRLSDNSQIWVYNGEEFNMKNFQYTL